MDPTRRSWLSTCFAISVWPEVLAAQQHAHGAVTLRTGRFETLDVDTAAEIEALTAQIIPSVGGPGAAEAGVIFFIDRALSTFARDEREAYHIGMSELQQKRRELFPQSTTIAALNDEQQKALIRAIETSSFFELLRTHTVLGFLGNPSYGGNRGKVGWHEIGFDDRMAWQPPFGYYDVEVNSKQPDREPAIGSKK
ncbi:MAG TPA: gluconate 2-dehydrogenase subunit 3 family protein [Bryobacteraceae bacterium]|jgi:gluconate 2-dehydrogenase gamma chain|nr:gluconate 2-dehydrogenase subunit 3 family protein [Bryobacteraceae bacterium]